MIITFWIVVALVGLLLIPNARYAFRQYWANRNRALFTIYMAFLIALGYLVVMLCTRFLAFAQTSQEMLNTF